MGKKQLKLGAFMRPASIHTGAWRYPGAFPDANFNLKHLKRFAQTLERARFDAFFMADHLAVLNMPLWVEPTVFATWSVIFLLWGPGRRGVMSNLKSILPGSTAVGNFFRCYRVFWNFSNVIADNVRYKELRVGPDWEFTGSEYFEELHAREGGAIVLTAHMGSSDLGAQLFAEIAGRPLMMVRAPEADPDTRRYEEELHERTVTQALKVDFSTRASALALDLLHALQRGEIIAIQGDRVTPGISSLPG